MPIYSVQAPNGLIYDVEGPEGASQEEVIAAVLQQNPEAATPIEPESGVIAGVKRGAEGLLSAGQTALGATFGSPEEAARAGLERSRRMGEKYADDVSLEKVKQAYEQDGVLSAAGEAVSQIPSAIAQQLPQLGASLGSARLGALAGSAFGPAGTVAGGITGLVAPSLLQQFGGNVEAQAAAQQERGEDVSIDRQAALGAAIPQAGLDVIGNLVPLGGNLVSKFTGIPVQALFGKSAANVRKLADERLLATLTKGTAVGAGVEIPTEIAQQMLERSQAGLSLTDEDAMATYADVAYQAGLLGPVGAVGRVSERSGARGEVAQQKATEQAAADAELAAIQEQERIVTERDAAAQAQRVEQERNSTDYALRVGQEYEQKLAQFKQDRAALGKAPKDADPATRLEFKERQDALKERSKELTALAPEYNRTKPIRSAFLQEQDTARVQGEQRVQAAEDARYADIETQSARDQETRALTAADSARQTALPGMEQIETTTPAPVVQDGPDARTAQNLLEQTRQLESLLEQNQQDLSEAAGDTAKLSSLFERRDLIETELTAVRQSLKDAGVTDTVDVSSKIAAAQKKLAADKAKLAKMQGPGFDPVEARKILDRINKAETQTIPALEQQAGPQTALDLGTPRDLAAPMTGAEYNQMLVERRRATQSAADLEEQGYLEDVAAQEAQAEVQAQASREAGIRVNEEREGLSAIQSAALERQTPEQVDRKLRMLAKLTEQRGKVADATVDRLIDDLINTLPKADQPRGRTIAKTGMGGETGGRTRLKADALPEELQQRIAGSRFATGNIDANTATRLFNRQRSILADFEDNVETNATSERPAPPEVVATIARRAFTKAFFDEMDLRLVLADRPTLSLDQILKTTKTLQPLFLNVARQGANVKPASIAALEAAVAKNRADVLGNLDDAPAPVIRPAGPRERRRFIAPVEDFALEGDRPISGTRQTEAAFDRAMLADTLDAETESLLRSARALNAAPESDTGSVLLAELNRVAREQKLTPEGRQALEDAVRLRADVALDTSVQGTLPMGLEPTALTRTTPARFQKALDTAPEVRKAKAKQEREDRIEELDAKRRAGIERRRAEINKQTPEQRRAAQAVEAKREQDELDAKRQIQERVKAVLTRANAPSVGGSFKRVERDTASAQTRTKLLGLAKAYGSLDAQVAGLVQQTREAMQTLNSLTKTKLEDRTKDEQRRIDVASNQAISATDKLTELTNKRANIEQQIDQVYADAPKVTTTEGGSLREAMEGEVQRRQTSRDAKLIEEAASDALASKGRKRSPLVRETRPIPTQLRTGTEQSRTKETASVADRNVKQGRKATGPVAEKQEIETAEAVEAARNKLEIQLAIRDAEALRKKTPAQKRADRKLEEQIKKELAKSEKLATQSSQVKLSSILDEDLDADYDLPALFQKSGQVSGRALSDDTTQALINSNLGEALNGIEDSTGNRVNAAVAQRLKMLVKNTKVVVVQDLRNDDGGPAFGAASKDGGAIFLDANSGFSEHTVLHESIHAVTERLIQADESTLTADQLKAKRELQAIFEDIQNDPAITNDNAKESLSEFVADALSDTQLQAELYSRPWTLKNAWESFKSTLLNLLGIKVPANQLEATLFAADKLFKRVERPTAENTATLAPAVYRKNDIKSGALQSALDAADLVVARNKSNIEKVKESATALNFETSYVDRFAPMERIAKLLPKHAGTQMMYYLRMFDQRMNFSSQSVANGALDLVKKKRADGQDEFVIESVSGPSLRSVVELLRGAKPLVGDVEAVNRLFTLYLAGKRAERVGLEKLDLKGTLTQAKLDAAMRDIEGTAGLKDVFEKARNEYNSYNKGMINFAAKAGALSDKVAKELNATEDYVPYYRERNGQAEMVLGNEGIIRIGNIKEQPHLKELVGDGSPILDFMTSSVRNTSMLTEMALNNIATKNAIMELSALGMAKNSPSKMQGPDVVKYKDNGEDRYAIIETDAAGVPAELLVKGLAGVPVQLTGLMRFASVPASFLRKAITVSPLYAARQLFRDSLAAPLTSGADFLPVIDALKEIGSNNKRVLESRGVTGGQQFTGTAEDMSMLLRGIADDKSNAFNLLAKAESFAMAADALTRRAQYNSYIKQGLSEMEATLMSLESMNFTKRGASPSVHMANALVPFFNAQIQGLNVLYKAATGKMPFNERLKIQEKLLKRGAMLAATAVAYTLAMQDDEAYKNANPATKYGNFFLRVPGFEEPIKVPVPFEIGYIFKSLPEAIINMASDDQTTAGTIEAFKGILLQTIPGGSSLGIPQVLKPGIEVGLGKSFYTGRDILSAREQRLRPEEQYRDNTTEIAKLFGNLGISPIKVEQFVNGYTGSMGLAFMAALSVPLTGTSEVQSATKRLSDYPVLKGLFQSNDAGGIINDTYTKMDEFQKVKRSYTDLLRRGERAKAMALIQEEGDKFALAGMADKFTAGMTKFSKIEAAVRASNASPEQKREQLNKLRRMKIDFAKKMRDAASESKRQ